MYVYVCICTHTYTHWVPSVWQLVPRGQQTKWYLEYADLFGRYSWG